MTAPTVIATTVSVVGVMTSVAVAIILAAMPVDVTCFGDWNKRHKRQSGSDRCNRADSFSHLVSLNYRVRDAAGKGSRRSGKRRAFDTYFFENPCTEKSGDGTRRTSSVIKKATQLNRIGSVCA
jgi:hypothetical protein